jgi:hypothetical protein
MDWTYQARFVTDTNLRDSDAESLASSRFVHAGHGRAGIAPWDETGGAPAGHAARMTCGSGPYSRDWPTVSEILAAQGFRPRSGIGSGQEGANKTKPKVMRRPMPTVPRTPGEWTLPFWLAWVPAALAALGVGASGVALAALWSYDAYTSGMVAARLADSDARKVMKPLPEGVVPPKGGWWRSSAAGLVAWAAYLDRRSDDPADVEETRALLDRVAAIAPLDATVRFVRAHESVDNDTSPAEVLVRSLGQSRDVVTLIWTGRQLRAAGKKEAAMRAYGAALAMAARPDLERGDIPAYLDDMQTRRYALPGEDLLNVVIADLADAREWTFQSWSELLPRGTPATVAAARVLRERVSADADAALERALLPVEPSPGETAATAALRMATEAEALAMKQRWGEAENLYRQAIERIPSDLIRRSWWINVADLARRLNEESNRSEALDLAKSTDLKDDVTLRAIDLQKEMGTLAQRPPSKTAGARPSGEPAEKRR